MNPSVIALLALGGVAVVWLIVALARGEGKRAEAMRMASQGLGFVFEPRGDVALFQASADLPLFRHGHSKKVRNVMTGRAGDAEVKLFDYRYTTGSGKQSHTWAQSVALFPAGRGLPDFVLAPENVFHRIGQLFGYQDIDFEQNAEFSSRYLLRGRDETAIRAAFGDDRLAFFAGEPGWTIEVFNDFLAVYRAGKRCKPGEVQAFFSEAQRVWQALRTS